MFCALVHVLCVVPRVRYRSKVVIPCNFYNHVLFIDGCGWVSPRGSYITKVVVPCNCFTMFDTLMDMGVSAQGSDMDLRGYYLDTILLCFMH